MLGCRFFPSAAIIASVTGRRSGTILPGQQPAIIYRNPPILTNERLARIIEAA
jgi:hypothetical protein